MTLGVGIPHGLRIGLRLYANITHKKGSVSVSFSASQLKKKEYFKILVDGKDAFVADNTFNGLEAEVLI
jgi:hypothetical protein